MPGVVADEDDLAVMATLTEDERRAVMKKLKKLADKQAREQRVGAEALLGESLCTCAHAFTPTVTPKGGSSLCSCFNMSHIVSSLVAQENTNLSMCSRLSLMPATSVAVGADVHPQPHLRPLFLLFFLHCAVARGGGCASGSWL